MAKKTRTYHEDLDIKNTQKLKERIKLLPNFCVDFFRNLNDVTSSNTRMGYTYDLEIFFSYICLYEPDFKGRTINNFSISDLKRISADHLENYMDYLTIYEKDEDGLTTVYTNKERGKSRKLSAIRTMFSYFYKKSKIPSDPSALIDFPKIRNKNIVRLEVDEVARLLDEVESGDGLSERQLMFHNKLKTRDLAIVTLLLGTGIRVSECVGIDIDDVDFNTNGIKIMRKGGDESIIYFGHEVRKALADYLKERLNKTPDDGHENALFLSNRNSRITPRSVQNLVKKYSKQVTPLKNISPHKLRSTYGTSLYAETGDIYLVADVLGHKDVNTTRKHYAEVQDSRRRQAAKYVVLRKDE